MHRQYVIMDNRIASLHPKRACKNGVLPIIEGYYFDDNIIKKVLRHNCLLAKLGLSQRRRIALAGIFLALEPVCNFNCPYCYVGNMKNEFYYGLSLDEIKEIICTASLHGAKSVVVAGDGEPMLSRHIWKVIKCTLQQGMIPVVFTNGSVITRRIAKKLFSNNVSVILKVNSFRPQIQDFLIGVPNGNKLIYKALATLLRTGFQAPKFALQSVITKINMSDLKTLFLFCRENNIVPYFETYVAVGHGARPSVRSLLEPSREDIQRFFLKIQKLDRDLFQMHWEICPRQRVVGYGACNKSYAMLNISSNGDVYRCVTESECIGNIRETPFETILADPGTISELIKNNCTGCHSATL